jgi:hypothetical protein
MLVAAGSVAGIGRLQDLRQEPSPDALQKTVERQNDLICSPPPMNAESMPTAQIGGSRVQAADQSVTRSAWGLSLVWRFELAGG